MQANLESFHLWQTCKYGILGRLAPSHTIKGSPEMPAIPSPLADDLTFTALAGLPLSPRKPRDILGLTREGASDSFPAVLRGFVRAFHECAACDVLSAAISGTLASPHSRFFWAERYL